MLMYLTDHVPSNAIEQENQTLHEQYHAIQAEYSVLKRYYQTLYDHFHTVLDRSPLRQGPDPDKAAYRQALHDYSQSLQEQRRVMQHFRHTLHTHLIRTRSSLSNLHSDLPAGRPLIRKTILLGMGNEQEAAVLIEGMQQAGAHRVFLATDSSQVLCIMHNVHIDVLVLDDDSIPFQGRKLYHHLQGMQGLETLPVILMSTSFYPLLREERVQPNLIGLEKPITGEALVEVIDQLGSGEAVPHASSSCTMERNTDALYMRGTSKLLPSFV